MTLWVTCPVCQRQLGVKGNITFGPYTKNEYINKHCRCKDENKESLLFRIRSIIRRIL